MPTFYTAQGFDGPLPLLVPSCDCLPVQKLMMTALAVVNRKIVHSVMNPIGCEVKKLGQANKQVRRWNGFG